MKKTLAILLVLVMAFALFACNAKEATPDSPPAASPESSTDSSPAASPSVSASAPPSASAPATPVPTTSTNVATVNDPVPPAPEPGTSTIGYFTDDVDHFARDQYYVIYYNYRPTQVAFQVEEALGQLGEVYNFRSEQLSANGDADAYVNNLTTILLSGPDGLIIDITAELAPRVAEICSEFEVPVVCIYNRCVDVNDVEIIPAVVTDQFYNGRTQLTYLNDHYKDYWGDIDRSKITLLIMDWSTNIDIYNRGVGALEKWEEFFPGQTYYYGDTGADALSPESGFNVANSILSAHPEVEYWFIVGTVEDVTLGAGRAVEGLGISDKVLMTASGAAILPSEWDAGYDGPWIANYSVPPMMYAGAGICGLIALMDGRATMGTLWPEHFLPGDQAARYSIGAEMMSKATYQSYMADVAALFGVIYS